MANSRSYRLIPDLELLPARTPGSLGHFDAGDPSREAEVGDTPGSLGLNDHGDPDILRYRLIPTFYEFDRFEDAVLKAHIDSTTRRKGHGPLPGIPETELDKVEGKFKLRKEAAARCRALLHSARADLAAQKKKLADMSAKDRQAAEADDKKHGFVSVSDVKELGLTSAYRDPKRDAELWHNYFRHKYYWNTEKQRSSLAQWQGGKHGARAVALTVKYVGTRKAAPGFSNHTDGVAVDFYSVEGGETLKAETGNSDKQLKALNARWEKSWLYRWLEAHNREYRIHRIKTEAWHWEFELDKGVLWDGKSVSTTKYA